MHWEAYGECSYVQVDPFARFSAAQGASSLRVRASQTSIATVRAHEHQRAADMPSLPRASCKSIRAWCDSHEPAPELAYSDGGRTQTKGMRTVERLKPGLAEAARPLSAAHWVCGCILRPNRRLYAACASVAHWVGPSSQRTVCASTVLSRPPSDVPRALVSCCPPLIGAYARSTRHQHV